MGDRLDATRRDFLRIGALSAGGLVLGVRLSEAGAGGPATFRPNVWVRIEPSGKVFLTVGKSEMGQGVRTSLPTILAEELEVDVEQVELVQALPGPDFQDLGTFGSRSLRTLWLPLRTAGAAAREMLVAAAASRWGVETPACRAERGRVVHEATGRSIGYGALAEDAGKLSVPSAPQLKPRSAFRLIGQERKRVDAPRIVAGEATFASDVRRPGMKIACVVRCPVVGGTPRSWNEAAARAVPGVRSVAAVSAGLAVIADDTWAALRGREALEPTIAWDEGPNAKIGSAEMLARLEEAANQTGRVLRRGGDPEAAIAGAERRVEAEYFYPFQAHAPMEPMNAVADVRPGSCEIWAGTQNPNAAQAEAAKLLGLPESAVTVNVTLLGGGFGRRGPQDFVLDAVEASRAARAPVQVVWTRQDDMRQDYYHPVSLHRLKAGLDGSGGPVAWQHRVVGPALGRSRGQPESEQQLRADLGGAQDLPYAIPMISAELVETPSPVRIGAWRGIQNNHNMFVAECFADELAAAAKADPLRYRLALLEGKGDFIGGRQGVSVERTRLARVLSIAGEKSGWANPLPAGRGRGVACGVYDGFTYTAVVAEVSVEKDGTWRAERVVCAVDCGIPVNPLGIRAQVEGSVAWALSALATEITLRNGRVEQASYRDFPILSFRDMPRVETFISASEAAPTGMGEPPVPVTAAAVVNALFAASGRRLRRLPLRAGDLRGS